MAALANSSLYPKAALAFDLSPDKVKSVLFVSLKRMAVHMLAVGQ